MSAIDWATKLQDVIELRERLVTPDEELDDFERAQKTVGRAVCDYISNSPGSMFGGNLGTGIGGRAVCGKYWDSQNDPGPTEGASIEGGQCPDVRYDVFFTISNAYDDNCSGPKDVIGSRNNQPGPISAGRINVIDSSPRCNGNADAGVAQAVAVNGFGQEFSPAPLQAGTTAFITSGSTLSIRCVRSDGQPDTCGNGSGYNPGTGTQTLPTSGTTPDGVPYTIGEPQPLDSRGRPTGLPGLAVGVGFPVTIFDLPSNLVFPGAGFETPDEGGDPLAPTVPGDQGEPGSPVDTGEGGDAEGEDDDKYLVGVLVEVLSAGPSASVQYLSDRAIYRGCCYVYFGGEAGFSLNPQGAFTTQSQFFYAPEGANKWAVSALPGYNLRVTPYYKDSE